MNVAGARDPQSLVSNNDHWCNRRGCYWPIEQSVVRTSTNLIQRLCTNANQPI